MEAVVALPVFVVIFVGLFFLRDLTAARLFADQEARRCSWEYALSNNCITAPVGCENVVGGAHYGDLMPDVDSLMKKLGSGMGSLDASCTLEKGCTVGSKALGKIERVLQNFVLDYLSKAVSVRFDANKAIEVAQPGLFGGGTGVVSGKYGMACNIEGMNQNNIADLLWKQFAP